MRGFTKRSLSWKFQYSILKNAETSHIPASISENPVPLFENSKFLPTKSDKMMISILFSTALSTWDHIFLKIFLVEDFGIWVSYLPYLSLKSSFFVLVDLTKKSKQIPLKAFFLSLNIFKYISNAFQLSNNIRILNPGHKKKNKNN